MASALCIYIAVGELFYVYKNRKAKQGDVEFAKTTAFDLERVINLVKENDIIEFESNNLGTFYTKVKEVIREIDKDAFFLITDSYSVSK